MFISALKYIYMYMYMYMCMYMYMYMYMYMRIIYIYVYIYIILRKIEKIMCHGSLKVKTLARKAGDPWFDSRLWRILIFSIFLRILK